MHRVRVDVRRNGVRFAAVAFDRLRRPRVVDGVDHVEQLHRRVTTADAPQRDHRPQRRMRVLPAVFANPGQVALDVAGVVRHPIERRREQEHELGIAPDEMGVHGVHRAFRAARLRDLRKNRP